MATYETQYHDALDMLANYLAEREGPPEQVVRAGPLPDDLGNPRIVEPSRFLKPEELHSGFSPERLRLWIRSFQRFFDSGELSGTSFERQQGYLLNNISDELRLILDPKISSHTPVFGPGGCIEILKEEFVIIYPMFLRQLDYFQAQQKPHEDPVAFLDRLSALSIEAEVESLNRESTNVFRFISGLEDQTLRKRLFELRRQDMTEVRRVVTQHSQQLRAEAVLSQKGPVVAAVQPSSGRHSMQPQRATSVRERFRPTKREDMVGRCYSCGDPQHPQNYQCFAKNKRCNSCNKFGHLQNVCITTLFGLRRQPQMPRQQTAGRIGVVNDKSAIQAVNDQEYDLNDEVTPRLPVTVTHDNGQFSIHSFPDSGSAATLIAEDLVKRYNIPTISVHNSKRFTGIDGKTLPVSGRANLAIKTSTAIVHTSSVISPVISNELLIGYGDLKRLKVLPQTFPINLCSAESTDFTEIKNKFMLDYSTVLSDDLPEASVSGDKMHIHLVSDADIRPIRITTARQVPLHWRDKAERAIHKLTSSGVLVEVNEPCNWCSPGMFVAKSDGELRLVVDFTQLNKFVKRPHHGFPSSTEIVSGLDSDSKYFAKLDATQGYHQIPLDEDSSKLTTFMMPGTGRRYRYTRAAMGLSCSSDEFCRRSDTIVQGLPGVRKLVDDIIVQAPSIDVLIQRIKSVLDRCKEHNFTLSRKKFEIGSKVKFAGFIVGADGVAPDPDKLQGIRDFQTPTTATQLRSFLGMVNQMAGFHPSLAALTKPLHELTGKNKVFKWLPDHQTCFDNIKTTLTKTLSLQHFNTTLPTKLVTDASRLHGLGFALIQTPRTGSDHIIQCGSRSLQSAETRYSTVELECLAVSWAIRQCSYYLKGIQHFEVITDHKPLLGIFSKSLSEIDNPRLVRFREKIIGYPFTLNWVAGRINVIADALSRSPQQQTVSDTKPIRQASINACFLAPIRTKTSILKAIETCSSYSSIVKAFSDGKALQDLPLDHPARRLKPVWHELSLSEEGLLIIGGKRLYIPIAARAIILADLHKGHCGFKKIWETAKPLFFWPDIRNNIKQLTDTCEPCQALRPSLPKEPLLTTTADYPMHRMSSDLFQVGTSHYLVLVDRYSGYPFLKRLTQLKSNAVITTIDAWFKVFGYPTSIRTDGGPQFRTEFKNYCADRGICHEQSSPHHPEGNGHAEAAVKNMKYLVLKVKHIRL